MDTPKSVLIFISGCLAGVVIATVLLTPNGAIRAHNARSSQFTDVPINHVAASAVALLKSKGIVKGFPDDTYRGGQSVTRYELAVTLARFGQYYDHSKQPLVMTRVPLPAAPGWVTPSREYLASNGFVSAQSPLFKSPGTKLVTADQLAAMLSSVLVRLSDRSLPPMHS